MLIGLWVWLLSSLSLISQGRKLGTHGSILLSKSIGKLAIIIIVILLLINGDISLCYNMFSLSILKLDYNVTLDKVNVILLTAVIVVSGTVHHYSVNYIMTDKSKIIFIALLSIFTGSIIVIVVSDNLLQLFIGWELIGVTSYLLIGFWSNRLKANSSANKAFIINRIGDIALIYLLSILVIYVNDLNYLTINGLIESYNGPILLLTWSLLLASIAKSSQLGLHSWLPTSIEGPTPVSALIHAATLVTAGVFLIVKVNVLIDVNYGLIGLIGALTALIAGLIGCLQNDIKRLIAFSTISQIGYMFVSTSIINYSLTISHIINHAFFKALLFLCAGTLIHSSFENQDLRKYGSLLSNIPVTYVIVLFASISLIAIPSLTGYYSKELIISIAYGINSIYGYLIYLCTMLGAILTGFYSMKLIKLAFIQIDNRWNVHAEINYSDLITKSLLLLLSVVIGYLCSDIVIIIIDNNHFIDAELLSTSLNKILPLLLTLLGAIIQYILPLNSNLFTVILIKGYWFDEIISKLVQLLLSVNKLIIIKIDLGLLELIGPNGIALTINRLKVKISDLSNVSYYGILLILISLSIWLILILMNSKWILMLIILLVIWS